jgi:hypothetical protein
LPRLIGDLTKQYKFAHSHSARTDAPATNGATVEGHHSRTPQCPLLGVKRTSRKPPRISAYDPSGHSGMNGV